MKKFLFVFLIMALPLFSQQINYTWGLQADGSYYTGNGITYIDTTTGTTNNIYVDLLDYYPIDYNPLFSDDSVVIVNSDRMYIGTLYVNFDNKGADASNDSILFTIKAYPGIYTSSTKPLVGAAWGSAVTLETIARKGDYFSVNNVYLSSTKYKHLPPPLIKLEIAPIGRAGADDSTAVDWSFAYPAIYKVHEERKHGYK